MFKIIKDGALIGMTEAPKYIKKAANGCFNLCPELEAQGISFAGNPYHLLGRDELDGLETVSLEEADAGVELQAVSETVTSSAKLSGQMQTAARLYVRKATDISDDDALQMPDLFTTWKEALDAGEQLEANTVLNLDGQLYRVVQPVTPQEHQPPNGEGMTAIYRPIDQTHAGTLEDPIPWVYGMDSEQGKYYSYNGKVYLCNLTMPGCVYAPDTPGLWQWSEAGEVSE